MESWMDDVETQLASEDHGKDIVTVNNLLKKHQVTMHGISFNLIAHIYR